MKSGIGSSYLIIDDYRILSRIHRFSFHMEKNNRPCSWRRLLVKRMSLPKRRGKSCSRSSYVIIGLFSTLSRLQNYSTFCQYHNAFPLRRDEDKTKTATFTRDGFLQLKSCVNMHLVSIIRGIFFSCQQKRRNLSWLIKCIP